MASIISGWKRTAFTTQGADPTAVVIWKKGDVEIQEFQGVYRCTVGLVETYDEYLAVELHKALEDGHETMEHYVAADVENVCEHGYLPGSCRGCDPDGGR